MKKILLAAAVCAVSGLNAAAYFNGGLSQTTGPHGYSGANLDLVIGSGNLALKPSFATYTSNDPSIGGKTFRTYALRGEWQAEKYTLAGFAGATPEVNKYSNKFFGGDITLSLASGAPGQSRLAGPGAGGGSRGGRGVDVGAGFKRTIHTQTIGTADMDTGQTEGSVFAGAKILALNVSASYTGYTYDAGHAGAQNFVPGLNFELAAKPSSSVNVKLDLPGQPLLTPFVSYTGTKYKGGLPDSSAYLLGAYIDLRIAAANVSYQIFDSGSGKDSFLSVGAGIKF